MKTMKKVFSIFIVLMCVLIGGIVFTACNDDGDNSTTTPPPVGPQPPLLGKSNFSIVYDVKGDGTADYNLVWDAEYATKYDVVFDGVESTVTDEKLSLNDCTAGEIHTVTVTAIGVNNLKSETVEVKFKAAGKLDAPINVRLYADGSSTKLGWKESEDTTAYAVVCEELDQDLETGKPFGTGKFKSFLYNDNRISIDNLRTYYKNLELSSFESFRVKALPYNGSSTVLEYHADTEIIEYQLPSDVSTQSVYLLAGTMSNPTNVRWDFSDFEDHPNYAKVKWDGAAINYNYKVVVKYPGYSIGMETEKGASQGTVPFDYQNVTGDYTVTVESVCDEFRPVSESMEEKYSIWSFYLTTPTTEELKFHVDQTVLECPQNIRIQGENLVWDSVQYAEDYRVFMQCGELELSPSQYCDDSAATQISLQCVFEDAIDRINYAGDYDVSVMAYAIDNEYVGLENGVPQIKVYCSSEYSEPVSKLIRLKAIPKVQNAQLYSITPGGEDFIVTWDGVSEATSYYVGFYSNNGAGTGINLNADTTQYELRPNDLLGCDYMVVMAKCAYSVTTEDGITTISTSSSYLIQIED